LNLCVELVRFTEIDERGKVEDMILCSNHYNRSIKKIASAVMEAVNLPCQHK